MLNTGQRRSDVYRMTWADVTGNTIRVVQQRPAQATIPLHADLRAILAATKREHVDDPHHARYDAVHAFTASPAACGTPSTPPDLPLDCQPHGLRKAAGRRLAEAGCSSRELMAMPGHKTLAEAERYTREADQARLASAAVARLKGRSVNS